MRRIALATAVVLAVAACGGSESSESTASTTGDATTTSMGSITTTIGVESTTTVAGRAFPVDVEDDTGAVTIQERPEAVVSLSSTATEMLFAIGAGDQVVAVDEQSNYPAEAPVADLSGFTPNLEAILSYEPDLVIITFDPGDLIAGLGAAGVPVLTYTAAPTVSDVYRQMEALGAATGNTESAAAAIDEVEAGLAEAVASAVSSGEGVTYYHEIDATLYTVTSQTLFGEIYGLFGMINVADPADADGAAAGYPQLSAEFLVGSDPDIIFLADTLYGESVETVSDRPGWSVMSAVTGGHIEELDSDLASRWGPRIVDFAQAIADGLRHFYGG